MEPQVALIEDHPSMVTRAFSKLIQAMRPKYRCICPTPTHCGAAYKRLDVNEYYLEEFKSLFRLDFRSLLRLLSGLFFVPEAPSEGGPSEDWSV